MKSLTLIVLALLILNVEMGAEAKVEMTSVKSLTELAVLAELQFEERRRERGCEIQIREKIPPTLCYPSAAPQPALDLQCRALSRTAVRLPKIDRFTSPACKLALEKRAGDLAYAR